MIRGLVLFWFLPIAFFWSWYYISYYDLGFGLFFYSRELHDMVFAVYGATLGVEPEALPGMLAKVLMVDSSIVFGLIALRKHRAIARYIVSRRTGSLPSVFASASDESLSKAP